MKSFRLVLTGVVLALLVAGYAASQLAALGGPSLDDATAPFRYAKQIDQPPVQYAALLILVVCIVLAFVKDREANET